MRPEKSFALPAQQLSLFIEKALQWAMQQEEYFSYLSACDISYVYGAFPHLLAVGASAHHFLAHEPFESLQLLHENEPDWRFGYFTYDLKNSIHGLTSKHPDAMNLPACQFFSPKYLLIFETEAVRIQSTQQDHDQIFNAILNTAVTPLRKCLPADPLPNMSRDAYLQKVQTIKDHILEGDCYELNLCMEYLLEQYQEDPLMLFRQLNAISPSPFTSFQRYQQHYLISASPERFLKKERNMLISQPIKGTIRRGSTPAEDLALKAQLAASEKDKAENLMIVDLVRNDLARSCKWGSVSVPELFGIYGFRQVYQMISTISGELRADVPFTQAIKAAFPMGSMTGAPKRIVMELIDTYENSRRGLYSGAAGYITPEGDFDFNVVIRSFLYNSQQKRLSFSVGGAITWDSNPEEEYQECLLKAKALLQVLGAGSTKAQ